MLLKIEPTSIKSIRINKKFQHRSTMDRKAIKDWARLLKKRLFNFPPIVVYRIGTELYVVDGFHRLEAYVTADRSTIPCTIKNGSWDEAIKYSLFEANKQNNSIRETNEDKRNKIELVLLGETDGLGATLTDRYIAQEMGILSMTVGRVRKRLEKEGKLQPVLERTSLGGKKCKTMKSKNRCNTVAPVLEKDPEEETTPVTKIPQQLKPSKNGAGKQPKEELEERLVQLIKDCGHQDVLIKIVMDSSLPEIYLFRDELYERIEDDRSM